jgi:hypothetical protein
MSVQFPRKRWYVLAAILILVLALTGCSLFGKPKKTESTPTQTPPPTETPLPVLPTYTPTKVPEFPTATPTNTPVGATQAKPTLTPTKAVPQAATKAPTQTSGTGLVVAPAKITVTRVPTYGNNIRNGSFEDGFTDKGVAKEWTAFSTDGAAYAWVDESKPVHVSHDSHAQLMQIMGPEKPDRFVGIYQTVNVVAGQTYTLALHGLIRSSMANNSSTPYGHRVQWAIDDGAQKSWSDVNADWSLWTDPGWNDVPLKESQPTMNAFVKQITPKSDKITLYIRGWTKWPILGSEAKYYIDGVFLEGPVPGQVAEVKATSGGETMPTTGGSAIWIPVLGGVLILGLAVWEIRRTRVR